MNVVDITQKGRDEERGRRPGAIINEKQRTRRTYGRSRMLKDFAAELRRRLLRHGN